MITLNNIQLVKQLLRLFYQLHWAMQLLLNFLTLSGWFIRGIYDSSQVTIWSTYHDMYPPMCIPPSSQ